MIPPPSRDSSPVNILIVEDDASVLRLYEVILKDRSRYRIVGVAKNGEKAVEIYASMEDKPDVVIMDYKLPKKNGIEASLEILSGDKKAVIVFASADCTIERKALDIGAASFLRKPFGVLELMECIEKAASLNKKGKNKVMALE